MTYKTMQELVTRVERALYQTAGAQVQLYSQEIIMQQVQDAFDHVFADQWWPQFRRRETRTLNGTTGEITTALIHIKRYEDIQYVFKENARRPIPEMPAGYNSTITIGNGTPKFIEATGGTKLFKIYPETAAGTILIVGRARYDDFILTDTVPFDPTVLTHFAAWQYFTDDDNLASAAKHRILYESKYDKLKKDNLHGPILLDTESSDIPDRWSEWSR